MGVQDISLFGVPHWSVLRVARLLPVLLRAGLPGAGPRTTGGHFLTAGEDSEIIGEKTVGCTRVMPSELGKLR